MKSTIDYLEAAKATLELSSDYAMAKWLGVSKQALSMYRTGTRVIDNYAAARIAEALEIDPFEVISAAEFEREKDEKRKAFWKAKITHGMAATLLLSAGISTAYENFDGLNSLFCILC